MVAKSGWKEFHFKNQFGDPIFLRIHAARKVGEGWKEEPTSTFTIRNNRMLAGDDAVEEEEFQMIAKAWHETTGGTLKRPFYTQIMNAIKEFVEESGGDNAPPT